MGYVNFESIAITATSSGSHTHTSVKAYTGLVHMVRYIASATTSDVIGAGATIAITGERNGQTILSLTAGPSTSASYYVVDTTVDTAGSASTGSASIPLANERVIITVTSGSTQDGDAVKNGTINLFVT